MSVPRAMKFPQVLTDGPVTHDGIFLHGRNQDACTAAAIAQKLGFDAVRWRFPQAKGGSWYPGLYDAAVDVNASAVSAAFIMLDDLVDDCTHPIILGGFSQGACLAAEYVLRGRRRIDSVIVLTGSRLGSAEAGVPPSDLAGVTAILTGGDSDEWVPAARVQQTERELSAARAKIYSRIFPRKPHGLSDEEIDFVRTAFAACTSPSTIALRQ